MKTFILVLIAILLVNACAKKPLNEGPTFFSNLRCTDIAPRRGLSVDFIGNAPPTELTPGKRFPVSLKFANYHREPIYADITVQDDSGTQNVGTKKFEVTVEGATYENNRLVVPGCNINEDLPEKNLGLFSYNLDANKDIRFVAKVKYEYASTISGSLCVFNPIVSSSTGCSASESLTGPTALGPGTAYDPVTVTRMDKTLVGTDQNHVIVNLDVYIKNLVKSGVVSSPDQETVSFRIASEIPLNCRTRKENDNKGTFFDVILDEEGEARVNCESMLSLDRLEQGTFTIELAYPYEYFIVSQPIRYRAEERR